MSHRHALSLLAGVCAAAVSGHAALAQTAAPAAGASSTQLEEVVVTAERREASLQDVPISVTALNTEKLEAKQIVDVLTLTKVVPGMVAKQTFTPMEITMSIRGVTQLIPALVADPAIGSYVDGVYNAINAGSNSAMIDMERVEVLKGPQGTLFGRNTIGGAISITTNKPTDDFGGYVEAAVGNYNAQTYTGVINGPIIPGVVDARLVYQHNQHDGYGHDSATNKDTFSQKQDYVRGTVKVTPADGWEVLVGGFYNKAHGASPGTRLSFYDPASSIIGIIPLLSGNPTDSISNYVNKGGFYDTASGLQSAYQLKTYGATGTITGQINDAVTVKSITAYTKTDYNTATDLDATPYVILDLLSFPIKAKQFSEEFQVYGDAMDSKLKWIAGAYYYRETGSQISNASVLAAFSPPALRGFNPSGAEPAKNTSYSAFAQLSYEILPHLRLTGGARYVTDKRNITYHDHSAIGLTPPGTFAACNLANDPGDTNPANCVFKDSVTYHYVPWTVGLDYKVTDDVLLYAKVAKGFRSGAFTMAGPAATPPSATITPAQAAVANAFTLANFKPVAPERLVSYETGFKAEFLDHRLRINGAGYWSSYANLQVTVNLPAACPTCTPNAVLINSGSAHIWGGELEATALIQKLELNATVGYTHPKYVKGPSVGTDVINVSKLNYSLSGTYPIETSVGVLNLNATYSYRSKASFYPISPGLAAGAAAALSQKGYGLIDAQASFDLAKIPLTVAVFGTNLANKKYITSSTNFAPPLGFAVNWPGVPRTYGVSLKYKY